MRCFRIPGLSRNFHGFPGPMFFPGLSRPEILNNKIPGLSRVCTGDVNHHCVGSPNSVSQVLTKIYKVMHKKPK